MASVFFSESVVPRPPRSWRSRQRPRRLGSKPGRRPRWKGSNHRVTGRNEALINAQWLQCSSVSQWFQDHHICDGRVSGLGGLEASQAAVHGGRG